jgi:hypothetical protein
MSLYNDIDAGGRPAHLHSQGGQAIQATVAIRKAASAFTGGASLHKLDIDGWLEAWRPLGGFPAGSLGALRLLHQQFEELRQNSEMQPVFLQPAWTAQPNPMYPSRLDPHDGWYLVDAFMADPETHNGRGAMEMKGTLTRVGAAGPSAMALTLAGGSFATTSPYIAGGSPVASFPIGTLGQFSPATRAGAEGVIPISVLGLPPPSYVPFVPPAPAGLWTGGVTVWDTMSTATYPVPLAGGFTNGNWVKVYGPQHGQLGDLVVTNGLLLLLFQPGTSNLCSVYLWNTLLTPPAWQLIGNVQYQDNAGNTGTLRSIDLDRVSIWETRLHVKAISSAGTWSMFRMRLLGGHYDVPIEFWPQVNTTSQLALLWSCATPYTTGFNDTGNSTTFPSNLPTGATTGYAAVQAAATNSPVYGFLFQNPPTTAQGRLVTSSSFAYGDTLGPIGGSYRQYGVFAVPYAGAPSVITAGGIALGAWNEMMFDLRNLRWALG